MTVSSSPCYPWSVLSPPPNGHPHNVDQPEGRVTYVWPMHYHVHVTPDIGSGDAVSVWCWHRLSHHFGPIRSWVQLCRNHAQVLITARSGPRGEARGVKSEEQARKIASSPGPASLKLNWNRKLRFNFWYLLFDYMGILEILYINSFKTSNNLLTW